MSSLLGQKVDYHPYTLVGHQDGMPIITHVTPNEEYFDFEWIDSYDKSNQRATLYLSYDKIRFEKYMELESGSARVYARKNRVAIFYLETPDGRRSQWVNVQCARYPGDSVVNYLHPDDKRYDFSGKYLCSPSIARLGKELFVSMDVYGLAMPQYASILFKSGDEGKTWQYVCDIVPMYWGSMFAHKGNLYLLGVTTEYGQLTLAESKDGGNSWRSILIGARGVSHAQNVGAHKAPVRVRNYDGRLWVANEWGSWNTPEHFRVGALSIGEDEDLMNPDNWKSTGFLHVNPLINGAKCDAIEGNILEHNGEFINFMRFGRNKAMIVKLDKSNPEKMPEFGGFVECPFAHTKFQIEKINGAFYAVGNECPYRNKLAVYKSDDLKNWTEIGVIQDYSDLPPNLVGVQYPDFIVEGDQLLVAVRTAVNGAHDFHDSNCITFHRFRI